MIIVGFSNKTYLPIVRLICRRFKHCVIITKHANKFVLHQFVKRNNIAQIAITQRSITKLKSNGWVFITLTQKCNKFNVHACTCVNYAKSAIGLNKFWIQTPNALYKYLKKNLA